MHKLLFIAILTYCASQAFGQDVQIKSVNIKEIKERTKSTSDTIYIINFWATWCKPCVEEMPVIENIQESFKEIPVKVLLVSLDFENQVNSKLIPFIKKNYILNEVVVLNESNPNQWIPQVNESWSGAIPACWFIYRYKELFHEGQVTPDIIKHQLNSLLD
ncbi:redoxin domain-containing protein [Labilibacter sediminis]|nr:redoxin domain-containing protein [Labilibacter sediminis]